MVPWPRFFSLAHQRFFPSPLAKWKHTKHFSSFVSAVLYFLIITLFRSYISFVLVFISVFYWLDFDSYVTHPWPYAS